MKERDRTLYADAIAAYEAGETLKEAKEKAIIPISQQAFACVLERNGISRRRPGPRGSYGPRNPDRVNEMVARRNDGESFQSIAFRFGCTRQNVEQIYRKYS